VSLKIYNLSGQLIRTLVNKERLPGNYSIAWNGKDALGKQVCGGVYFYQLKTDNGFSETKKMLLLKWQ